MSTFNTDPHSNLDDLILRARMLLGTGLTPGEALAHLVQAGEVEEVVWFAVKAAEMANGDHE